VVHDYPEAENFVSDLCREHDYYKEKDLHINLANYLRGVEDIKHDTFFELKDACNRIR
jgi:hypothetical protein